MGLVVVGALEVSAAVRALVEEDKAEEDELLDVVRTATEDDDEVTVAGWQVAVREVVSTTIHSASDVE